jgi:hypothetical protein
VRFSFIRRGPLGLRATVAGTIAAVAGLADASPASAATERATCGGPLLVVDDTVGLEWAPAVQAARARVRKNDDLDRCAALRIDRAEDGLRIRVTTADGRAALRKISAPERLVPTLEALLVLPPLATTPSAPDPYEPPDEATGGPPERAPPEAPGRAAHLEVGVGAIGRVAGAPLYGGGGFASFAQLAMDRWLVGVTARWEAIDDTLALPSPSGFNMQTFEVGVGIGRRAIIGPLGLDAVLGPEVIVENQEAEGPADGLGGTASDVRVDLLLRMSVPQSGRTRFYTSADADVSPSRLRRTKQLDSGLPALPAWSTGVQLGVVWGAL